MSDLLPARPLTRYSRTPYSVVSVHTVIVGFDQLYSGTTTISSYENGTGHMASSL